MMGPDRHTVVGVVTGLAMLWAGGARAQTKPVPSTLLPMEQVWSTSLLGAPTAAPVHEAGRVFVALRDGYVTAVNLVDGDIVWQVEHPVVGQPAVEGELLYVASRDELHGLKTATGRTRWSISLEAPLSAPLVTSTSGWLIVALETQTLLALRADTGEEVWRTEMSGSINVPPSLAADRMYVSLATGDVVALSLLTGAAMWKQHLGGAPDRILPLDDLFVGATDNFFYSLSRLDGSIKWRWPTGGDIVGLPAVDEKRVYFASRDNQLWALNRNSGVQQWHQSLAVRPTAGPRQMGDLLVLGGTSQYLRFFDPLTGVTYGRIPSSSELAHPPLSLSTAASGPLLITVTGDGQLEAFGHATGPTQLDLATAFLDTALELPAAALFGEDGDVAAASDNDASEAAVTQARPSVGGEYAVQVMAFSAGASATALVERLVRKGHPAYVLEPRQSDVPALYRVRVGDYPDRLAAEAIGRQVEDEDELDWFVVSLP